MASRKPKIGGGWASILYTLRKARQSGGILRMWNALRARNACKTCALGMGGQLGGMTNEKRLFPEVCKKSVQAMAADMQGAIHEHFFDDVSLEKLRRFTSRELEAAGRLTQPLYAGPLDSHYRKISWDDALEKIAGKLAKTSPDESFFYFSGRSSNEAAFIFQLFARLYGTNNINNCSYFCHQASGVGLTSVTGSGAGTVTLDDIDHADLIFVIGANPASNHPRFLRTLVELRRRGGKVIVINPIREPGMVKFKVPSDWRSMLKASQIADEFVQPHVGGDCALFAGMLKAVIERGASDKRFVTQYAESWDECREHIESLSWEEITNRCGISREEIERIAAIYGRSKNTIFAWAMGITHHEHGVANVQMLANLALARGMIGRPGAGLLPLRGHSNVQGVGSMGVVPNLKDAIRTRLETAFDVSLPDDEGLDTLAAIERAHDGRIRFASLMGGNLYGASPDANYVAEAFSKIDFVVHFNTTLNTGHAWGRGRETLILPVIARDEERAPTTQESMFSYVRFSDGGEPRHEGPRSEVDLTIDIARRVLGKQSPVEWDRYRDRRKIREKIAQVIPGYAPIGEIDTTKREFHVEGRRFAEPVFNTESGKARFHAVDLPPAVIDGRHNELRLMTMRSEGQFNTVVYEEEDVYRGLDRRDVILMNPQDIERFGLKENQRVKVTSAAGSLGNVLVRAFDIAPGNAAMYYPESNILVPRVADAQSRTPTYKSFAVQVEVDDAPEASTAMHDEARTPATAARQSSMKPC